ncbi:MAG: hypothetical protein MJ016_03535 [Victivallaceae bacterium]|nr:hypothetical protein [Victivallaceae bacterium]
MIDNKKTMLELLLALGAGYYLYRRSVLLDMRRVEKWFRAQPSFGMPDVFPVLTRQQTTDGKYKITACLFDDKARKVLAGTIWIARKLDKRLLEMENVSIADISC